MRRNLFIFLAAIQIFSGAMCKQSSTAPEIETPQLPDISIACSPGFGGAGTVFTVSVTLNNTRKEIKVFGMEMSFDADVLEFRGADKGDLTGNWADVDANEISNGKLKIGGFTGSGTPVPPGSSGTITEIRLKVRDANVNAGQTTQICIDNFTDDISGLTPTPACSSFDPII